MPRKKKNDAQRVFLLVVDQSEEKAAAIKYVCHRAKRQGDHIALLYIIEPSDFQHWVSVGKLMDQEKREEAENLLSKTADEVKNSTSITPTLYIREGKSSEELIKLINEDETISILVLGADVGPKGPGPLITSLVDNFGKLAVPLTIVPGTLKDEDIKVLA